MTTLERLTDALSRAEDERKKAVKPYDLRIKGLKDAIKGVKAFDAGTDVINNREPEKVESIREENN